MGSLRVKFWGTRGLISSPRPETAIFGGNTPCVQILYKDHLILVDSGFGSTNLGDDLMARLAARQEPLHVHIFYTHFHWDHIQGLPFFKPIYFPSTTMSLYSPQPTARMLDNLNILFDGSYSPFESLLSMQAKVHLCQLSGPFELDGLRIDYRAVDHVASDHPGEETYAYKFAAENLGTVCLITDHEVRNNKKNRALVEWAKGCDLLIHDGQYFAADYLAHVGWGHSSAQAALDNALKIGPALTLLTHHDPARNDRELQAQHRALMQGKKYRRLTFEFAREEVLYEVAKVKSLPKAG